MTDCGKASQEMHIGDERLRERDLFGRTGWLEKTSRGIVEQPPEKKARNTLRHNFTSKDYRFQNLNKPTDSMLRPRL